MKKTIILFLALVFGDLAAMDLKNECIVGGSQFSIMGYFKVKYLDGRTSSQAYQIDCTISQSACSGIWIRPKNGKVGALDIGQMTDVKITEKKGPAYEISWGPYRKIFFNTEKMSIIYSESAANSVGQDEVSCK